MKGLKLKQILTELNISQADFARMIGTSPQNLCSALSAQDLKSSMIEEASRVLDKPVSWFYGEEDYVTQNDACDDKIDIRLYDKKVEECAMLKAKIKELEAKK